MSLLRLGLFPEEWKARAMSLLFPLFTANLVLTNATTFDALRGLRLACRYAMFSSPPARGPVVVRGRPRDGDVWRIVVDPNRPSDSWARRLHDVREIKWHDALGRLAELRQPYLAYQCRLRGGAYAELELVAQAEGGQSEKRLAWRRCDREGGTP